MLLAVNVGNTQTHIGMFAGVELKTEWRIATQQRRTSDELALVFQQFLELEGFSFSRQVTGVAISSVVPTLTAALREMVPRYFHFDPVLVEPGTRTGMPILVENPREVGADRIANAVGAHELVGGPAIVIDFGTATTVDVVSEKGEFLGGVIVPGIEISANALWTVAAQIQKVELFAPESVIGKSTGDAVRSGVVIGAAALVDGMIDRIVKELGSDARAVATGGLAPLVLESCFASIQHEPNLTLYGIRTIYDRNVEV